MDAATWTSSTFAHPVTHTRPSHWPRPKAGKAILCEKPLANTVDEARRMLDAVNRAGVTHMLCHNYRRAPAVQLAKRMIETGRIGRIRHYRGVYLQDWIVDPASPRVWRLEKAKAGSGALGDIVSHSIDLARFLVGEISEVSGLLETFIGERPLLDGSGMGPVDVDDAALALLRFENGAIGTVEGSRFAPGRKNYNRFEINGSRGSLAFHMERMNELEYYSLDEGTRRCSGFRQRAWPPIPGTHPFVEGLVAGGPHHWIRAHLHPHRGRFRARDCFGRPAKARLRRRPAQPAAAGRHRALGLQSKLGECMSARAGRARRASRFVLGFLLVLTVVWLLVSFWYSRVYNAPFSVVARQVPAGLFDSLVCAVIGCPAELPEGMAQRVFDEILITGPPVAIHVDEMDRVWVAESDRVYGGAEDNRASAFWLEDDLASHSVEDRHAYIQKWLAAGSFEDPDHFTARADKIVRLEDTDADGVADRRTELATFNDVLDGIGAGIIVRGDDVWYLNIPNIWRLHAPEDRPEAAALEKLHTGFGVKTSLMGHDMHGLVWGPDGLLYFSVGDRGYNVTTYEGRRLESSLGPGRGAVFRMNPDGSQLEVFAEGLRNPQELAFDEFGNLFTVDNNGDGGDRARIVYVVEGGDSGWAMPYQSLIGDYVLGPWNAERLWETRHPGQPAWILPPIDYLGAGPSGLLHYPGLGLPDSYQGYFFVCDYAYQIARSGVRAFKLEPRGAGFEMLDSRDFIASVIATDLSFGFDGRIYVARYSQIGETQSIMVASHDEARGDPRVAEAARLAREGMKDREPGVLGALLGHADQRIRQRAQFELAERGEVEVLASAAADSKAPLIARIHGIWGLTQLGANALEQAGWKDLAWADGNDELRAQAVKAAGETAAGWLLDELIDLLADPSARVRFFAAQSLGKLGATRAVQPLVTLLRENADEDVFLRHGAVFALHRIGDLDAMWALRADPSQAVRLGALLVLRRAADPRVADFLIDPEPALRVEAARAIYDVPIRAALPALAALAGTQHGFRADDRQTSQAFHRRVIGAALAVGSRAAAVALAAHAADVDNPASMRRMALESLGHFTAPQPRDLAMGWYRPLAQRSTEVVYAALDEYGLALVRDDDLGDRALEVASAYGRIPLEDSELLGLIRMIERPSHGA